MITDIMTVTPVVGSYFSDHEYVSFGISVQCFWIPRRLYFSIELAVRSVGWFGICLWKGGLMGGVKLRVAKYTMCSSDLCMNSGPLLLKRIVVLYKL